MDATTQAKWLHLLSSKTDALEQALLEIWIMLTNGPSPEPGFDRTHHEGGGDGF